MDPAEIVQHHLEAIGAADLDEVLADYSDESLLLTVNGAVTGLEALREFFGGALSGLFAPGTYEMAVDELKVEGKTALLIWHGSMQKAQIPFAVDTFVIEGEKIAIQTFAAKVEPK